MPVKRGLVAPQNIFIQTIIKKFDGSRKSVKLLSQYRWLNFLFHKNVLCFHDAVQLQAVILIHNAF